MKEYAFVVQKGSDFYNKYFKMWNEKQKFFRIADNWFHKEGFQNANYHKWRKPPCFSYGDRGKSLVGFGHG